MRFFTLTKQDLSPHGSRLLTALLIVAVLCALFCTAAPLPVQASTAETITITSDGVEAPLTLTLSELQEMPQVQQLYSAYNTYPTRKLYAVEGVRLTDLLDKAGINKEEAQVLTFRSSDGYTWVFSKEYLLTGERYYFPNLADNSTEGRDPVEPLIAFRSGSSANFDDLNSDDTPRLFYGQRALSEQTTNGFIKYINRIEVSNEPLGQCNPPTVAPAPGLINPGTNITLQTMEPGGKIYYTTDGSIPDLNSPIFNLSDWNPNPPLHITTDTTRTAMVYNYQKLPSEPVTFSYQVDPHSTAPAVNLTAPPRGRAYYPGDQITITGTALNLETVELGITAPGGESIYSDNSLPVLEGQFTASFTLESDAPLGNYTISAGGTGISHPSTVIFQVKEDSSAIGGPNDGTKPDQIITSWSSDPRGTRVVSWRIKKDSGQSYIQCLVADDAFDGSFSGASWTFPGTVTELDEEHSRVQFNLSNLNPGSGPGQTLPHGERLVYHVGKAGAWSDPAYFTTADTSERAPFSFFFMGDVQEGYIQWGKMLRDAYAAHPEARFAIMSGDLVNNGNSSDEWSKFFAAATPIFQEIGLFPAPGNHDNTELFYRSFALPSGSPQGFSERFYSFDYGYAHFAVLNSNLMGAVGEDYTTISEWLKKDLNNCGKLWKFVVFHHPPYPAREGGAQAAVLQENWVPIFEECNVDMVFVGDDHLYMRTHPLLNDQIQNDPQDGIVYLMGNAGSKFYEPADFDYIAKVVSNTSTYQIIHIDGNMLTLTSKDLNGQVIDSYTIRKEGSLTITSPESGQHYLPGEGIYVRGTSRNIAALTCRLLDPQGHEIRSSTRDVNKDFTITAGVGTSKDLAPGEYTVEISAEELAEPYSLMVKIEPTLTICGDGVTDPYTISYDELQATDLESAVYSAKLKNRTYAPVPAEGVRLRDLLETAGLKPEAQLFRFKYTGNSTITLTRAELLEETRYYYPHLEEESTEERVPVEALLTLRTGAGNPTGSGQHSQLQENRDWFNLILGQRTLNDVNARSQIPPVMVYGIKEIEVLTVAPEQAMPPEAWPPPLPVPAGTQIYFAHPDDAINIDAPAFTTIHYTLDGSDPTLDSPLYGEIKININQETTIKAVAYVTGKIPSIVSVYHYPITQEAYEEPVIFSPVAGTIYEPGDQVTIIGYSMGAVYIDVISPDGQPVYTHYVGTLKNESFFNNFSREFTLEENALAGEYTVKITKRNITGDSNTRTFLVAGEGLLAPPVLAAGTTTNYIGQSVELTFEDDPAWCEALASVTINGTLLATDQYSVDTNAITIDGNAFTAAGEYKIVIVAGGYNPASVTVEIAPPGENPSYLLTPLADEAYESGSTAAGIKTMTVKDDFPGFKYFRVQVIPIKAHDGQEAVVFTHWRNGVQFSMNITEADFDEDGLNPVQAGFNVQPGDLVKVYMVDKLSNDLNFNPTMLQN